MYVLPATIVSCIKAVCIIRKLGGKGVYCLAIAEQEDYVYEG